MATTIRKPSLGPVEIPLDRLHRVSEHQFRKAVEAGVFPPEDRVELAAGLLRAGTADGPIYALALDQYHAMIESGVLNEDDRAELLGGWIVAKMSINPPHQTSTRKVRRELERLRPPGCFLDQGCPIAMPLSGSEPDPDVLVVRGSLSNYTDHHPGPGDVALLVEVAHTSLAEDQGYKRRLYATEGISVYWIVNLVDTRLEVYSGPSGPTDAPDFASRTDYFPGQLLSFVLGGREIGVIAVVDLFPPPPIMV